MTQTYGIRPMGRDDLKDAQALIAAVDLFPPDLVAEMAAPALSGASADLWWIADGGKALAYAVPERTTEGTWNLLLLAVDPAVQGQGLGRALVVAVETKLRKMNARLLIVETSGTADFAGARKFYQRLGFRREARIRDFYQPADDKVIFTRALAG
jgi:ribosomal protein S18 acetylase RimI-like enzyme